MRETNREMADKGMFSSELLDELQQHLREYRELKKATADGQSPASDKQQGNAQAGNG